MTEDATEALHTSRRSRGPVLRATSRSAGAGPNDHRRGPVTGKVVAVKDGDTIEVLTQESLRKESLRSGRAATVRLHGIDAPEMGQPFGRAAKRAASRYAFGTVDRVRITGMDRYGRAVVQAVCAPRWRAGAPGARRPQREPGPVGPAESNAAVGL